MKVTLVRSRAIDAAVTRLAATLAEGGHNVELLVWDRGNHFGENTSRLYRTLRFRLSAPYDRPIVAFFLPLWWTFETLFLLATRTDVIHACDLDTLFPAIAARLVKKVRLVYTVYDFYADNIHWERFRTVSKVLRVLLASAEKYGISFAEVVFLPDESRLAELRGAEVKHVVFAYNSPKDTQVGNSHSAPSKSLRLFYAGLLVRSGRGLDYIVQAVRGLENVRLTLAGAGPDEAYFREIARRNSNVEFVGWISSYEKVIRFEMESDVLFRFQDPKIPKSRYESPNKLFEAMMCGKPIIVSDGGSMARIVKDEMCGLVVPYGDVQALREAITSLRDDPQLRVQLGRNGRLAYERKYSGDLMSKRILDAYKELTSVPNATMKG